MAYASVLLSNGYSVAVSSVFGGAGTNALKAAVPTKRFVVTYLHLESTAAAKLILKSGTTALTGLLDITDTGPILHESGGFPILKATAVNEALNLTSDAAATITGWIYLVESGQL